MNIRKNYPIELLKIIEPICQQNLDYIKPDKASKNYRLLDKYPNSDFFFEIFQDFKQQGTTNFVSVLIKPTSGNFPQIYNNQISYREVGNKLSYWIRIIQEAAKLKSIYDDEIVKGYQQEFFRELQIDIQDDSPVSFKDLPKLEEYIDFIESEINNINDSEPEKEEIKLLCSNLKTNITKESKSEIFKQITMTWALFTKTKGYRYTKKIIQKLLDLTLPVLAEKTINIFLP